MPSVLEENLTVEFEQLSNEAMADWLGAYGNASPSPFIRARFRAIAQRLRHIPEDELDRLLALANPGFGGK